MRSNCLTTHIAAAIISLLSFPAFAQSGHGAHSHGEGSLNAIRDGKLVAIEIMLAGADVVGFEHEAENDADVRAVQNALKTLGAVENVIALPPSAGCKVIESEAHSSMLHDHERHGHRHEKGHGGFVAHYELECVSPSMLSDIRVNLFSMLKSLHEIDLNSVIGSRQHSKVLRAGANTFSLVE